MDGRAFAFVRHGWSTFYRPCTKIAIFLTALGSNFCQSGAFSIVYNNQNTLKKSEEVKLCKFRVSVLRH